MSLSSQKTTTTQLVLSALMASLCCVMTMLIRIPVPATGGFVNLGDTAVILCGWFLSPLWAAISAGLGSALADLLSGYPQYAPATFIIKGLMALLFCLLLKVSERFSQKSTFIRYISVVVAMLLCEAVMILGYFFFEAVLLGYGIGAAAAILPNAFQGLCGLLGGAILISVFARSGIRERFLKK